MFNKIYFIGINKRLFNKIKAVNSARMLRHVCWKIRQKSWFKTFLLEFFTVHSLTSDMFLLAVPSHSICISRSANKYMTLESVVGTYCQSHITAASDANFSAFNFITSHSSLWREHPPPSTQTQPAADSSLVVWTKCFVVVKVYVSMVTGGSHADAGRRIQNRCGIGRVSLIPSC